MVREARQRRLEPCGHQPGHILRDPADAAPQDEEIEPKRGCASAGDLRMGAMVPPFVLTRNSPLLPPLRWRTIEFADANGNVYDKAARDIWHRPLLLQCDAGRNTGDGADAVAGGQAAGWPDAVQAAMRDLPHQQRD